MDAVDKRSFKLYLIVIFLGSICSVLGVGAVLPFISLLVHPSKLLAISIFHGWGYSKTVLFFTIILILAFAIKNMVSLLLMKYQYNFLFNLIAKIQQRLFSTYIRSNYEYHLNRKTHDLIKNINNETNILSQYVIAPLGTVLVELFSSFFVFLFLLVINPVFTLLISTFLMISIVLFMARIRSGINKYSLWRTQIWSRITKHVLQSLNGIKEVKVYGLESNILNKFRKDTLMLKESSSFQLVYSQAPRLVVEFVGVSVIMSVVCGFVLFGTDPQSLFILLGVFGIAAAQLLPSLNRLSQAVVQIQYGLPALKTIYTELSDVGTNEFDLLKTQQSPTKMCFSTMVEFANIHYEYKDGTKALNGVDVKIYKNKKIAFVGASGAGKTTLVDLLLGLYSPSKGAVSLDGSIISTPSEKKGFQRLFSYVPQQIILFDQSIKQNIAFGELEKDIDTERVWDCLARANLDGFVQDLKDKENTFIGENGVRLSGGQRQRVGIARALYLQSEILVLDEATSALDNKTENEIISILSSIENITIVTIAHRLTTVQNYDLIYFMNNGRVVSVGTFNELYNECDQFRLMVDCVDGTVEL